MRPPMKRLLAVFPLIFLLACQRPEVEAFKRNPAPVAITFEVPATVPAGPEVAKEYAAALRARMATRTMVVPEGVKAPENAAELRVKITGWRGEGSKPSPGAVGAITGVAVGTLSALAGNRDAVFDGFFWGMWAGSQTAAARDREARLGYQPQRVDAQVALYRAGDPEPLLAFAVEPYEVIDAMDPLGRADREDEFRIREEEAKAFARVVVFKIQERFNWLPLAKPSWYGVKAGETRDEDEFPEPAKVPEPPKAPEPPAPPETPEKS